MRDEGRGLRQRHRRIAPRRQALTCVAKGSDEITVSFARLNFHVVPTRHLGRHFGDKLTFSV